MGYFPKELWEWQKDIHQLAKDKGWYTPPPTVEGRLILIHSEVSEALEEYRNGHSLNEIYYVTDKDGHTKPEGVPIELADAVIRLLDAAEYFGFDMLEAITIKHEYNKTRPQRHGGKVI
jgi:hypothetical protein